MSKSPRIKTHDKGFVASSYRRVVMLHILLLLIAITGCGTFHNVQADGTVVRHYFGYTRVKIPTHASDKGDFSVTEISSTGVRFWPSVGLGFFHERNEFIPLDSRIVVRVQNQKQLDEVLKVLGPIAKDGLCVSTEK